MRKAGINEWDVMLDRYVNEVNAQELTKLREGLANTRDGGIARRWLLLAQNETLVRSQDYFPVLKSLAAKPWHTYIIWDFVKNNWDALVDRFTLNNRYLGWMVKSVTTTFTTEQQLKEMQDFFAANPEAGSGARARKQALETVEKNIKWINKYEGPLHKWFLEHTQENESRNIFLSGPE
ncbi:unnamed protein product [Meganyctiphanes norvegica]|uniref:ERAP1-like C-terminal domain-containing protein n=1 Tax=Meganyctiphanes norvegica TaxID=48144 RepID=A0AAV2PVV9_MEGNR